MEYEELLEQVTKTPRVHGYISLDTETRLSPIQGLGLFSKRTLPEKEVVAVWGGRVTTRDEIEQLPEVIGYHYALELYPGFYLAERSVTELDSADFINHSCNPNCEIVNQFTMITAKPIAQDQELTADFSNHTNTGKSFVCNCGADNCRKVIYFN